MLNFAVGPVQSGEAVLEIGAQQVPYFRTAEFSEVMKENEQLMLEFSHAPEGSRVVFLTGSGTAAMESVVINVLSEDDRALVVDGGSFGHRFCQLCEVHGVPFDRIALPAGKALRTEDLEPFEGGGHSALLINVHETSTGVLFDLELVSDFCRRNGLLLVVDAISSFLADELDMSTAGIDVMITGSQKALACPPGVSLVVLAPGALARVEAHPTTCLYLDLKAALKDGERGQTPFTPAVGTLLQINARLREIRDGGGVAREVARTRALAEDFRQKIAGLPLAITSESLSNACTPLHPLNVNAKDVFATLKDEYDIWVCPNGGELAERQFRVGHLGALTSEDNTTLVAALQDLQRRGQL